jgi:hypothetical protein
MKCNVNILRDSDFTDSVPLELLKVGIGLSAIHISLLL